jgi:nicotinamidase/pyrazinamidase
MRALIIVDVQNDFLPGGALAVPHGDEVIPVINRLQNDFDLVVATQDWHPEDHGSFAANHEDKKPGDRIELNGLDQILWPVHCVQDSKGADFAAALDMSKVEKVFTKGTDKEIDSYSGFFDNGRKKATGLGDYLKSKGVKEVVITGLAADYCVKFTALDAKGLGFDTTLVKDATRAVNLQPDDFEKALEEMKQKGIKVVESGEL